MSVRERQAPHRYGLLLGLVLLSFLLQEALPGSGWTTLLAGAVQGATLLVALHTSGARPRLRRAAALAIAAALVASLIAAIVGGDVPEGFLSIVPALLAALALIAVARGLVDLVRDEQRVTLNVVAGVISIYLLIGYVFAFTYGAVTAFSSGPVFAGVTGDGDAQDRLYFSLVTLTTTGYGDITARSDLARALAVLEALTGQLYLVTAVAVSVANLRPRSNPERRSPP